VSLGDGMYFSGWVVWVGTGWLGFLGLFAMDSVFVDGLGLLGG
jgi:hypothetical protein